MSEIPKPPETREFVHDGSNVVGRRMEILGRSEPACTYSLGDGTVISLRLHLVEVYKLDGVTTPEGRPVYKFGSALTSHVWVAEENKA